MALEVTTIVTNVGKRHIAENLINGSAIQVTHYQLGTGGVDPSSGTVLAPQPSAEQLREPLGGFVELTDSDIMGHCPIWTAEVTGVAGPLSEVGLWAQEIETLNSGGVTYKAGSMFLFSIGTYGTHDIMASETFTVVISIQF